MKKKLAAAAVIAAAALAVWLLYPRKVTVSFYCGEELLEQQVVPKGDEFPLPVPQTPEGMRFVRWEPEPVPAEADCSYNALFVPALENHVPYLFPDEKGMLCPEESFTGEMLSDALHALGGKTVDSIPNGVLSASQLCEVMAVYFPEAELSDSTEPLTRAQAAGILNRLLGRCNEKIAVNPDVRRFADLSPALESYTDLMEASIPHTEGFRKWKTIALKTDYEPGFELIDGRLRYFDEYGCLVTNSLVDGIFQMDSEGYYTSGNAELDGLVTHLIASFQEKEPEADRMRLLRMAYNHIRDFYKYLNRASYEMGATGWEIEDAIAMLTTHYGNCYKFTAAFWALARGMGFPAEAISGKISVYPHAWVKLNWEGNVYYCDPELEMANREEGGYDWDLFMKEVSQTAFWRYHEPEAADES